MKYTFDKIFLVSDIHGEFNRILSHISNNNVTNSLYLQIGDFGAFKGNMRSIEKLNDILSEDNNMIFAIRGNHDDPSFFNGDEHSEWKSKLGSIVFIEDYKVININFENYLFIGGAISIDRSKGIINYDYFTDENVIRVDIDVREIDNIITHTAPSFCFPLSIPKSILDEYVLDINLKDDIDSEREYLSDLYNKLSNTNNIKRYYYGHFHTDQRFYYNNTMFMCLPKNNIERIG